MHIRSGRKVRSNGINRIRVRIIGIIGIKTTGTTVIGEIKIIGTRITGIKTSNRTIIKIGIKISNNSGINNNSRIGISNSNRIGISNSNRLGISSSRINKIKINSKDKKAKKTTIKTTKIIIGTIITKLSLKTTHLRKITKITINNNGIRTRKDNNLLAIGPIGAQVRIHRKAERTKTKITTIIGTTMITIKIMVSGQIKIKMISGTKLGTITIRIRIRIIRAKIVERIRTNNSSSTRVNLEVLH